MKSDDSKAIRHGYRLAVEILRELETVGADRGSLVPAADNTTFRDQAQDRTVLGYPTRAQIAGGQEVLEGFAAALEDASTTAQGAFPSAPSYRAMIRHGVPHRRAGGAS